MFGVFLLATAGSNAWSGSAEAVVRGLEQAAAKEQAEETLQQADKAVAGESSSREAVGIGRAFVCRKAGLIRHIAVEYPSAETGYVCRVLYETEKGSSVPWYAKNEHSYCSARAGGLVKKHLSLGWDCVEQ